MKKDIILTCHEGTNADLFPHALSLYVSRGSKIADVTFGKGVFWKNVPKDHYDLHASDLITGIDFTRLPYKDDDFDAVVFDPPYMNGGGNVKQSIDKCYKTSGPNNTGNMCHENVLVLYLAGIIEARRVLKRKGILFIKCQAAVSDHIQKMTHAQLITILPMIGFRVEDEFVLRQTSVPIMRHDIQQHARKNHSYLLVFRRMR